jgi:hypothetical protein
MSGDKMAIAQIEFEVAEDLETVTAAQVLRWLNARNSGRVSGEFFTAIHVVERAAAAVGRANRLLRGEL